MTRLLLARQEARSRRSFRLAAAGLIFGFSAVLAFQAKADCQEDIGKIMKRRLDAVAQVNKASKTAGGKLDPISACPKLKALAAVEGEATAYFQKNKDWCNVPGDFLEKMSASYQRTSGFAGKACSLAVQVKKAQQQQAQQQQEMAPKLPAGPL
jgi:hypothetical protein